MIAFAHRQTAGVAMRVFSLLEFEGILIDKTAALAARTRGRRLTKTGFQR
jgi:hypothetical protein